MRERVVAARQRHLRQANRFRGLVISCNVHMGVEHLSEFCGLKNGGKDLLHLALQQFTLSLRSKERILRVARTIADLEDIDKIGLHYIAEAINHRTMNRAWFN